MVDLWVDRDSLSRFRAETLVSQAQGDFETQMAGLSDAHNAIRQAHSDFYNQLGSLNEQYAPSPSTQPQTTSSQPPSPVGADSGSATDLPPGPSATGPGQVQGTDYRAMARASAQKAGFDPDIFERQIQQESGFDPNAVSPAGARGIAQIVPKYHPGVNPDDPQAALDYAANLMASNVKQYGNVRDALVAYDGGMGAVNAWQAGKPYDESQRYVNAILGGNTGDRWAQEAASPQPTSPVARPSQFGDPELTPAEAYAACGPAAAVWAAQNQGRNPTLREALDLAKQTGWTPDGGMNGIANEKALLDKMGVANHIETNINWQNIANDAQGGNPVIVSTPGHYFTVDGYQQGKFHVGTSGTDLKAGSEWMTAQQMQGLMGNANGVLYVDHPAASGPSVAEITRSGTPLGSGAPVESSTLQVPKAESADDIVRSATDAFNADLSKLNLPALTSAGQSGAPGRPQMPGVPDFFSQPQSAQEAVQKAGDVAMNTPKPLFGPQGLGVGDPRIGPPGGEEEGAARGPAGEVLAAGDEGLATSGGKAGNIGLGKYPENARPAIQAGSATVPQEATRGVVSDDMVRDLAASSGVSPQEIVNNWKPSEAFNAETLFQIRDALADAGRQIDSAQAALKDNPGDVQAMSRLVDAVTWHWQVQQVVAGGTAEMGRGLRSLRMPVSGDLSAINRIQADLASRGLSPEEAAKTWASLDLSDPKTIAQLAQQFNPLPPDEYMGPAGPTRGQLPLFDEQPLPYGGPKPPPGREDIGTDVPPGQLSLGLNAEFANPQPKPAEVTVERNPVWAAMAEGKKTIFSLVPFHNLSIGVGTAFGPAGLDGFAQYVRAQLPGGAKYVEDLKNGPLGEWFTRLDKWPGMNIQGSNPEAGSFVTSNPWSKAIGQRVIPATGGFGVGYTTGKKEGMSDEDAFRRGLVMGGAGAVLGPTAAQALHNSLWQNGVPLAKVLTFKALVENGVPEPQAARFTRDLMGGGQLEELVRDQGLQRVIRLGVMAPDWTISQFRLAGSAATGAAKSAPGMTNLLGPMKGNEQAARDFWLKVVGTGMIATEALQLALTGHPTSQNQPGNLFKLEIPNGDGQTYSAYSLLPGNVEPLLSLADNATSGGSRPGPNFPSSALNATGAYIANRSGIGPRAVINTLANQQYPGGPSVVPPNTPPGQAALPEFSQAASAFGPIGLQEPIREYEKGAPLPAYLASAFGVKVNEGREPNLQKPIKLPRGGAPEPKMPWQFLADALTGQSDQNRVVHLKRGG